MHSRRNLVTWIATGLVLAGLMPAASAQVASAMLREGDAVGSGYTVYSLQSPDVNHVGGWALNLNATDPNGTFSMAWGSVDGVTPPAVLFMEGLYGGVTQTSWEFPIGMSNAGAIGYSSSSDQGDSAWIDATLYALAGLPIPPGPYGDRYYTYASAPTMTADGVLYWVSGTADTPGGSNTAEAIFSSNGDVILYGAAEIAGLPFPLTPDDVDFDYRFSAYGTNFITIALMNTSTLSDGVMLINAQPLFLDGGLVRENDPVPAAIGGQVGELWDNFDYMWINEMGEYIFTGDTLDGAGGTTQDEFVVVSGQIVAREGFPSANGYPINGAIENAAMNENGDWAVIWDIDDPGAGNIEALIVNGDVVLREALDPVDWDNNGVPDAGVVLTGSAFTGTRSLRVSDRDASGNIQVLFAADVSDNGAAAVGGFFMMTVPTTAGPAGDLQLSVVDTPDPLTTVPGKITYKVSLRNNGATPLTGVTVISTLDGSLVFDAASSDPIAVHDGSPTGGTVTATIGAVPAYGIAAYQFVVDATTAGTKTTTSVATLNESDPLPANNTVVSETEVGASTDLSIAIDDTPDPLTEPNGDITYTVTVLNSGPSTATGIVATVTLDPTVSFSSTTLGTHDGSPTGGVVTANVGTLGDDGQVVFDIVVKANTQGLLTTTGNVTGNQSDPELGNNDDTETTLYELSADLSIVGTDSPDPVLPVGGAITYSITVTNDGPSPATGVVATVQLSPDTSFASSTLGSHDGVPSGGTVTVNIGDLAASLPVTFDVVVTTNAAGRPAAVLAVVGSGTEVDPDTSNNGGPLTTLVLDNLYTVPVGVYSDHTGHPTAQVPGHPGLEFTTFDRPERSPNTKLWILGADTATNELVLVGGRCGGDVLVEENVSQFDPAGVGDIVGPIDTELSINDAGSFAFATNTSAATTQDEVIAKYDAVTKDFVVIAREGDYAAPTGANYGSILFGANITSTGTVWFVADTTLADTDTDYFVLSKNGNAVTLQEGVSMPTGQLGTEVWDNFDTGDLSIDAAGTHYAVQGDLSGDIAADDVFAIDNGVVVQQSVILAGSSFTAGADEVTYGRMLADGTWFARGDNQDGQDWVLRNGAVVATSEAPIAPGSVESYSQAPYSATFFLFAANNHGDYIIGGTTDAVDDASNAVLVLNGETIILRENDPIDLDGNGVLDDDARINTFGNDDLIFTDDYQVYFVATLRHDDGSSAGDAFIHLNLCQIAGVCGDLNGDSLVDGADYTLMLNAIGHTLCDPEYTPCADFDQDGIVTFVDYQAWAACYRAVNPRARLIAVPGEAMDLEVRPTSPVLRPASDTPLQR